MEKKQYRRKCSGQFNKEGTQGALLRRSVFSYYSPNDRIYDRIVAVVTHPYSYYVFTTIDVLNLPRFAYSVINLTILKAFTYSANRRKTGQILSVTVPQDY